MNGLDHFSGVNQIYQGDCIDVMASWPENFVDTIITDPPYGIGFMGKAWDTFQREYLDKERIYQAERAGTYDQSLEANRNFQTWCCAWAREALRIAKPGAIMLVSGGTRTFHRMTAGLEDAGWQIRDCLMWIYGSGFPKSLNVAKAIDNAKGVEHEGQYGSSRKRNGKCEICGKWFVSGTPCQCPRTNNTLTTDLAKEWDGWGTALKPAWEPIIVAMKPLDGTFAHNAEVHGVAGLNVDGARIGTDTITTQAKKEMYGAGSTQTMRDQGFRPYNVDNRECPESTHRGRWPANLILDEEAAGMLDGQSGAQKSGVAIQRNRDGQVHNEVFGAYKKPPCADVGLGDSGGASRFFYCAKASRSERNGGCEGMGETHRATIGRVKDRVENGVVTNSRKAEVLNANTHPTVKPLSLMKYLCMLTKTPTGGIVLDPFAGSGTTLWAAECHNRPWIGIEMNPEYVAIAEARIARERAQMKMAI